MWDALSKHAQVELALDHEHRYINDLVNAVRHQLLYGAPVSKQLIALQTMEAYLQVNCMSEEMIMDEYSFPLSRAHKEEHRAHCKALRGIEANIKASRVDDALAGLMALHQVLLAHIRDKDQDILDWKSLQMRCEMLAARSRGQMR
jgi:hemerythrin-like metal-binding protein